FAHALEQGLGGAGARLFQLWRGLQLRPVTVRARRAIPVDGGAVVEGLRATGAADGPLHLAAAAVLAALGVHAVATRHEILVEDGVARRIERNLQHDAVGAGARLVLDPGLHLPDLGLLDRR